MAWKIAWKIKKIKIKKVTLYCDFPKKYQPNHLIGSIIRTAKRSEGERGRTKLSGACPPDVCVCLGLTDGSLDVEKMPISETGHLETLLHSGYMGPSFFISPWHSNHPKM